MAARVFLAVLLLGLALPAGALEPVDTWLDDGERTFDGATGLAIPDAPELRGERGLVLDCWIFPTEPSGPARNVVTKPDEYMLRIDPAAAGGTLSFYVKTNGTVWEPRVRGPVLEPHRWHHVVAAWDRRAARMWVDRRAYNVNRTGECRPAAGPLIIGGPVADELAGLVGRLKDVRLFRHPDRGALLRLAYGIPDSPPGPGRTETDFRFDDGLDGWQSDPDTRIETRAGALHAYGMEPATAVLWVSGLAIDAASHRYATVRVSAVDPERVVLTVVGPEMLREFPMAIRGPEGFATVTFDCARFGPWSGTIETVLLRVEDDFPVVLSLASLSFGPEPAAPPDLAIESLAPERRIGPVGRPLSVVAWLANHGGTADATVRLAASPGIAVTGAPEIALTDLKYGDRRDARWTVTADRPVEGEVRAEVAVAGQPVAAMVRPVRFSASPEADAVAVARSRPWLTAGFPRAMDFRHLGPGSVGYLEPNTALLVDFIGDKIQAAREFKARYPDKLVLMQVNDEPNGIWGSWHVVPREYAVKEGLKFDETVFPMPSFKGWWLLGPPAPVPIDFPADAQTLSVPVPDVAPFVHTAYGRERPRDVMLYATVDGKPDWSAAEYASVESLDKAASTITLRRWPAEAVGRWRGFRAGQAMVAPSVGSVYGLGGAATIRTWIPNLTPACPVDPATGQDAAAWWVDHFVALWHERIAPSEPAPDGYQFDGLAERPEADCNLDGQVDGCQLGGVNLWQQGLHQFFSALRARLPNALVLADASNVWGSRSLGVLNGSENEEYPSFLGPDYHSSGFDLYRVWSRFAQPPNASYVQGRYHCDTYLEDDGATVRERGTLHPDSLVRMSLAGACMANGIYTFRTSSKRDVGAILAGGGQVSYPWDEYHAGDQGQWNWLGQPLEEAQRMSGHLGPNLLPEMTPAGWELRLRESHRAASVRGHGDVLEAIVERIETAGRPPAPKVAGAAVQLVSPATTEPLEPAAEYALQATVTAPGVGASWRWAGFVLEVDGQPGLEQPALIGPEPREVWLTLRPPRAGIGRVVVSCGGELGPLYLANVRLRAGAAEVFSRRFEHGLVLLNGSATREATFNVGPGYRRLRGRQAPKINTGATVGSLVTVPPSDGLFLQLHEAD